MNGNSQFVVQCWQRTYLVAGDHPHPDAVKQQLDDHLGRHIIPILTDTLAPLLDQHEGIWLVDTLAADLTLDLSPATADRLATAVGRQIGRSVTRIVAGPPDGRNIRYFPSRAAFMAQFLADYLAGRAWDRWEYQPLAGLASLTPSQTVREAITRDGADTARALLGLLWQTGQWPQVRSILTERDAARVWTNAAKSSSPARRADIEQLVALWPAAGLKPAPRWTTAKNKLQLWAAWLGQKTDKHTAAPDAVETWLNFLDFAADIGPVALDVERLANGETAPAAAAQLARLANGDSAWLKRLVSAVLPPVAATTAPTPVIASPAASLFALLPTLIDLKLPELLAGHAPTPAIGRTWLAWLALQCLGSAASARHRTDPGFLSALGLAEPLGETTWHEATLAATAGRLASIQADFWELLRRQRRADGRHLAISATPGGDVIHDMAADYWLAVTPNRAAMLAELARRLEQPDPGIWLAGSPPPTAEPGATFARFYKPAAPAVAYFELPELNARLNRAWLPLAQAVLRTFARRLLGFGWSSAEYLSRNFLTGVGQLSLAPNRIEVLLPAVPLGSVLRLAGLHHTEFNLPWADDIVVRLSLP